MNDKTLMVGEKTYALRGVLGRGGFSTVMEGFDVTNPQRKLALKIVTNVPGSSRHAAVERMYIRREILSMRKVRHKNVVQLLGYDLHTTHNGESVAVLVQEIATRGELFQYIMHLGKFDERLSHYLFVQICCGVQAIHKAGLVHRDLTMQNVMLDHKFNVKIIDLQFATPFVRNGQPVEMRSNLGTHCYMAPEVGSGAVYNEKCDSWNLGVILFILNCGFQPYQQAHANDWWFNKLQKSKYRLFWKAHDRSVLLDSSLKTLIEGLLTYHPKARYEISDIMKHDWYSQETMLKVDYRLAMSDLWQKLQLAYTSSPSTPRATA